VTSSGARLAVVGGCGVGLSFRVDALPHPGETLKARSLTMVNGGKAANHAIGLARLGFDAVLVSARGDDALGEVVAQTLRTHGVSEAGVAVVDAPTMTGALLVEDGGDNVIVLASGALDHVDAAAVRAHGDVIRGSELTVVSLEIPVAGAVEALRIARAAGRRSVLNLSPAPPPSDVEALLAVADIIVLNEGEARAAAGGALDAESAARALCSRGAALVVVTLGERGALAFDGATVTAVPAAPVPAFVDSSGAGDAFLCGVVAGLARRASLEDALALGARLAALILGGPGFVESLDRW
jgi:ribokinase